MNELKTYLEERLEQLEAETENEETKYAEKGYIEQWQVSDIRKRVHELFMLCKYGMKDKELEAKAKEIYERIKTLDEESDRFK